MPGAGKSTVGKLLAESLKVKFIDLDREIENKYGSINDIFKDKGEKHFRKLESEELSGIVKLDDEMIVATGGGVLINATNEKLMKNSGTLIWLKARPEALINRLRNDDLNRPLLKDGLYNSIERLYSLRNSLYEKSADIVIDTNDKNAESVVDEILDIFDSN
jgi:shikimate kinase